MVTPFHLSQKQDVIYWITEKNKETSVGSTQIAYTSDPIRGYFSYMIKKSIPIQTKEGPIWISRNALNYLSVPEKKSSLPAIDQLSLHILAENKLQRQSTLAPLSDEEIEALNSFLSLFKLNIKKDIRDITQPKILINFFKEEQEKEPKTPSSSTPEFIVKLLLQLPKYQPEQSVKSSLTSPKTTETNPRSAALQKITDDFLKETTTSTIPALITALRANPPIEDALFLRKFIHKIHSKQALSSHEKLELLHNLILEYEHQTIASAEKTKGYSFEDFSRAFIEEIFGPNNEKIGGYYYLNSILALQKICLDTEQQLNKVLSPHMKETLELYLMLHPTKVVHGSGPVAACLKKIDTEYKQAKLPTLWERMHEAMSQ